MAINPSRKRIFRRHPNTFRLTAAVLAAGFLLAFAELLLWMCLRFPQLNLTFKPLRPAVRYIYMNWDRDMVQFLPECSQHDPVLTYILKPGECVFRNREFETRLYINSLGLRDDEQSLYKPEIIILGDSYTLGWGVDQDSTFAQVLEQLSGRKVLNASMASYGTARELLLLDRIDLSNAKYLIIQYCANDFIENKSYVENNFQMENTTREGMEITFSKHKSRTRYIPLIYLKLFLQFWLVAEDIPSGNMAAATVLNAQRKPESPHPGNRMEERAQQEARLFLDILRHHKDKLAHLHILFFVLNSYPQGDWGFGQQALDQLKGCDCPDAILNMQYLYLSSRLSQSDFFILDDHLNAQGHKKVAAALDEAIRNYCTSSQSSAR